jgi:hypothetical protein
MWKIGTALRRSLINARYRIRGLHFCQKPGALHPVATAPIKALTCFWHFGLWVKIQATRFTGGR